MSAGEARAVAILLDGFQRLPLRAQVLIAQEIYARHAEALRGAFKELVHQARGRLFDRLAELLGGAHG